MSRISLFILSFITVCSFITPTGAVAQTTDMRTNTLQRQPVPVLPPIAPFYPIVPLENLDNFGFSTLEPTTLGKRTERTSNLEANPLTENIVEEEQSEETAEVVILESSSRETFNPLPERTRGRFYTWVDTDGVINVTNDPDSVPPGTGGK